MNENPTTEPKRLNDEELSGVAAAGECGNIPYAYSNVYINSDDYCGAINNTTNEITYRPCPRCGKPMHAAWYNTKWYCDPCNFSEYRPRAETWKGTKDSLIAAAR